MHTPTPLRNALRALALALLTVLGSSPAVADEPRIIFNGESQPPWQLFLGSESNWSVPVWGAETTTHKSEVLVARMLDENGADILQAEWNGGLAQIYWQQAIATDFSDLVEQDYALSVVARIDEKPKKSVDLKMDCGYPCGGSLNMTRLFKAVPEGQWFRMSFKLSCFKEAGANMANIFSPLVIMTTGAFTISISEASLQRNPPPESVIACG
ncbi:MAG: putative glycoside hydrolase [Xanthomonadales bacterium]